MHSLNRREVGRWASQLFGSPLFWIALIAILLYQSVVVPHWKPTWDSATYISLARSLAEGEGYTYMGYPHTKYPPGFPLLLAPIELLFGHHYWLMRLLIVLCAVGSVGVSYLLVRYVTTTRVAIAVSVMTAASYALWLEMTRILSDVPYMLFSLAALLAGERYLRHLTRNHALLFLGLTAAAYSIRIIGFTLALAAAVAILLNTRRTSLAARGRHAFVVLAVMVLVIGAWMGRNALVTHQLPSELREALSYERELVVTNPDNPHASIIDWSGLWARLSRNIPYYERLVSNLLSGHRAQSAFAIHGLSMLWLMGWGIALVRRHSVMEFYTILYVGIYLLWPSLQGARFLVPILPMIFYYALQPALLLFEWGRGLEREARLSSRYRMLKTRGTPGLFLVGRLSAVTEWIVLALVVLATVQLNAPSVEQTIHAERNEPYYQGTVADYIAAIRWVRDHTPPDSVIITDRAPWAYLISGRRSYTSPWVPDVDEVLRSIERNGGTHVIANDWGYSGRYLKPVIQAHPEQFTPLEQIGGNVIYAFSPSER